ncbi:PREDICTED: uncharacterized protein LOC107118550 [Gekko japonicus]|uniref:Uncharacterized protein LOC107118550 n=1 Tax=Gekko japonicus TaxID=146911 RepID=A0ABM1KRR6_GEKJA|nr:PREDICTED: uncharacterized protein LOC107118550 [Gekko japonicus]
MDFSSSFLLPCMLVILTIIDGRACADIERLTGIVGSKIVFPLEVQNQSYFSVAINGMTHSVNSKDCFKYGKRQMCLRNGSLDLENITQSDEGMYQFLSQNENKTFFLRVLELPPTVHIHCLPGGKAELSCEVGDLSSDVYWTLNGSHLNDSDICVKDGGRKIVLEKRVSGKLTCHRINSPTNFSTELLCDDGDLLKHPLFLVILAASGGAAVLLSIIVSLITCCCMKNKHNFIPVPAEDEKDEGITLSAISSEGPKSSPNGDHCDATDALAASTTNPGPGSSKPEAGMDPNSKVEPETEPGHQTEAEAVTEMEFREVMVDTAPPEAVGDCFPDPADA